MDRPLTVTKEMLEAILEASNNHAVSADYVTDEDVTEVNAALANTPLVGPAVIIDISNPVGMNPGHLAKVLNSHNNAFWDIAEESKKTREILENSLGQMLSSMNALVAQTAAANPTFVLADIRDAIRSLSDANILAQPLPPEGQVDDAAARVVQLLERRPDLLAAVRRKLDV